MHLEPRGGARAGDQVVAARRDPPLLGGARRAARPRAPQARWPGGSATRSVSCSRSRRSLPSMLAPLERRVLEPQRRGAARRDRRARPGPASSPPRAAPRPAGPRPVGPGRPARSGTPDPQPWRLGQLRELARGEREPLRDRVGVREQDLAGRRERHRVLAVQEPRPDLLLQRRDLLRHGGLRERGRAPRR